MRQSLPKSFIVGESLAWEKSFDDFPASDGWGGTCFAGSTMILLMSGVERASAAVKVGDEVMAFDEFGNLYPARVTQKFEHRASEMLHIKLEHDSLYVTGEHLILDGENKFVPARNIEKGNVLWRINRAAWYETAVQSVEKVQVYNEPVYNIEVERFHTYFANRVAVHNAKQVDL